MQSAGYPSGKHTHYAQRQHAGERFILNTRAVTVARHVYSNDRSRSEVLRDSSVLPLLTALTRSCAFLQTNYWNSDRTTLYVKWRCPELWLLQRNGALMRSPRAHAHNSGPFVVLNRSPPLRNGWQRGQTAGAASAQPAAAQNRCARSGSETREWEREKKARRSRATAHGVMYGYASVSLQQWEGVVGLA